MIDYHYPECSAATMTFGSYVDTPLLVKFFEMPKCNVSTNLFDCSNTLEGTVH